MLRSASLLILLMAIAATSADFECPETEGIFPDPDDCRSFYQCVYGRPPFHETCTLGPPATLFDDVLLICNYDYEVDCGDRPIIDGSTTPSTPPTTTTAQDTTTSAQVTTSPGETTTVGTTTDTTTSTTYSMGTTTTAAVTTTTAAGTTTTASGGQHTQRYPEKVMGMYIILADDTEEGYETDSDWEPELYDYQVQAGNVLFFTFINPETMIVPNAFEKLMATKGSGAKGSIPDDTIVLFAIGGYAYSIGVNPWPWLTSKEAAEAMAEEVATWVPTYGIDGIDLDIEEGAGGQAAAGPNLGHFIKRLREIEPDIIIGQPSYGYPQVQAANDVINLSWNIGATSNNYADSVGIMVYEGAQSLNYVENFAHGSEQWEGFPIQVDVPYEAILLGCKGSSPNDPIIQMANEVVRQDLLGIMVWFASVKNGLVYAESWDASQSLDSQTSYMQAREIMNAGRK